MMFNLNIPVLIFGSLIALLIGSTIHLIAGGKFIRLFFSMIFSWIGFWIGNYFSNYFSFQVFKLGIIDYGSAVICSICLGIFGFWISGENKTQGSKNELDF